MVKLVFVAVVVLLASCRAHYGPANPTSCHAKHIRDRHNDTHGYDICMAEYHQKQGSAYPHEDVIVANQTRQAEAAAPDLARRYGPLIVEADCAGELSAPSTASVEVSGVTVAQPCGLVWVSFIGDDRTKLEARYCSDVGPEACPSKLWRMFEARVIERYPEADAQKIANHCTGYPDDCEGPSEYEGQYFDSHNELVRNAWLADLRQIQGERDQAIVNQMVADRAAQEQAAAARKAAWVRFGSAVILSRPR